jgi:hypothetical protein
VYLSLNINPETKIIFIACILPGRINLSMP